MEVFTTILKQTLMITSFVMVMMLLIEYISVQTRGKLGSKFRNNSWLQIIFAVFMGIVPGCLGTYVVVSMYAHRLIGFAGLVAAMIATSGDEVFVMFTLIPDKALLLVLLLAATGIVSGFVIKLFMQSKSFIKMEHYQAYIHKNEPDCVVFQPKLFLKQLKYISFHRALLLTAALLLTVFIITGDIGHDHSMFIPFDSNNIEETKYSNHTEHKRNENQHEHQNTTEHTDTHEHDGFNWHTIVFLMVSLVGLFIVATVPEHFLVNHLWEHVIKKHFLNIFLWTFGAFVIIHFINEYLDTSHWISENQLYVLFIALFVGLIPESGPHIVFVTLFASGTIPFYILLANSIVQDGHGAIPLLAESRRSFIFMKLVNMLVGLIAGFIGFWLTQ